jgi:hypothetical protein
MEIGSGSENKHSTIESRHRMTFKGDLSELLGNTTGQHNSISSGNHVEELRALAMLLGRYVDRCAPYRCWCGLLSSEGGGDLLVSPLIFKFANRLCYKHNDNYHLTEDRNYYKDNKTFTQTFVCVFLRFFLNVDLLSE